MFFLFHTAVFYNGHFIYYNVYRVNEWEYYSELLEPNSEISDVPIGFTLLLKKGAEIIGSETHGQIAQIIFDEIEHYLQNATPASQKGSSSE